MYVTNARYGCDLRRKLIFHFGIKKRKNFAGERMTMIRATNREIDVIWSKDVGGKCGIIGTLGLFSLILIQTKRLSTENSVKHAYVSQHGIQTTIFVRVRDENRSCHDPILRWRNNRRRLHLILRRLRDNLLSAVGMAAICNLYSRMKTFHPIDNIKLRKKLLFQ